MMTIEFDWPMAERQKVRQAITLLGIQGISDLRPVWQRFGGTLRQRHRKTFDAQTDPISGVTWHPYTPAYYEWKLEHKRAKADKMLQLSGTMRKALTVPKSPWSHFISEPKLMEFGIVAPVIYPLVHQASSRTRKDGYPIRRGFIGMKLPDDLIILQKFIKTHLIGLWAKGGGKATGK